MMGADLPMVARFGSVPIYHDLKRHGRGRLCGTCGKVDNRPGGTRYWWR